MFSHFIHLEIAIKTSLKEMLRKISAGRTDDLTMITKEQWSEIERNLSLVFARAEFKLGEDEITVERRRVKEGRFDLVVFFNGSIKGAWSHDPESENYQPLIEKFWRKTTRSLLSKASRPKLSSSLFKKLNRKIVIFMPFWTKAKTLVNHFKKIKDLEFIEQDGVAGS